LRPGPNRVRDSDMALRRLVAIFSGAVHGVGFRYTTFRIAASCQVTGTVRNLPDGTVELVAEGDEDEVRAFLRKVRSSMSGYIRHSRESWRPAEGGYADFRISH